jgi:hypothetical protein
MFKIGATVAISSSYLQLKFLTEIPSLNSTNEPLGVQAPATKED